MQKMNGTVTGKDAECKFHIRHLDDVVDKNGTSIHRADLERALRYKHLDIPEFKVAETLLRGGIDLENLPCQKPKVVRMFVCSSGQDFEAERSYLFESVYPQVREYCRTNHGVDFQLVDMYWGDSSMPACDPHKMAAVHEELSHCQQTSMGPNFLLFIGQKYGEPHVPVEIPTTDMDSIRSALEKNGTDVTLLDKWFRKEMNGTPEVYRLVDINGDFSQEFSELVRLLQTGSSLTKNVPEIKCPMSDFELLVQTGILDQDRKSRDVNCLVYVRDIRNIDEHLGAKNAAMFVDLDTATGTWDAGRKGAMTALRSVVEKGVTSENMVKAEIELNGCTLDEEKSEQYVAEIGRHFYERVTQLVNQRMLERTPMYKDELLYDICLHWGQVGRYTGPLVARKEVLDSIKGYLLNETDQPLVFVGAQGSGKTSLIAKAANDINEAIANSDISMPTSLIVRFVGETGLSRDIQPFLYNVCHQLAYVTGRRRQDVPSEYRALKNHFIDLVQRGEYGGMLVILIDALDAMSSTDSGHKLDWLPSRLASNVKIVITVDSENEDMVSRLESKVEQGLIEIPNFTDVVCEDLVKQLIINCSKTKKTVWYDEWRRIQAIFKSVSSPLYAKLVYEQMVCTWRPFDEVSKEPVPKCIEDHITKLFEKLEKRHGRIFVQRVLGYLTAVSNGLSESELEDILSLDEDVLNDAYEKVGEYWSIRRIPQFFWPQLRYDLEPYIAVRQIDGIATITWRYKKFADVAARKYLPDNSETVRQMYSTMADYFLGEWSGTRKKPYQHPPMLMAKYKIVDCDDEGCRHVPSQPLWFGQFLKFNTRKLNNLPHTLLKSRRYEDLKASVFCNYEWIASKLRTSTVQRLIADFEMLDDREANLVADAIRMSKSALAIRPDALGTEITGRLLPHIHKYPYIKDLIRQCDLDVQRCCPLVPNSQIYSAPGGPLQYECDVGGFDDSNPIDIDVFSSPDGILLAAKPTYSSRLRVWELSNGEERPDIMLPLGAVRPSRGGKYINIFVDDCKLKTYRSDSGVFHGEMSYGPGKIAHVDVASKYLGLVLQKGAGPYVFDLERSEILHKFSYHTHAVAISDNEAYVLFNAERNILLYELPTMERRCVATATDVAHDIIFINDIPKCYVMTKTKLLESIQFDVVNRKSKTKTILTDMEAKECIPSNSKNLLIVRCSKTLHVVDTVLDRVRARFQKLPPGVFVDNSSQFSGAGFTPDDKMVVAARYTYLIIWDAATCSPIRVLQSAVSPMVKIFTPDSINKVVTLLKNNSFQVWDLANLDRDTDHSAEVHQGAVVSMAVSSSTDYILSHDNATPDAKLVCLRTGKVVDTLQHSDNVTDRVLEVLLSPDGQYAVTRARLVDTNGGIASTFDLVTDDVMWEVETASKVFHAMSNRYIVFSPSSHTAAFVTCAFYNRCDWSENIYNVFIVCPETSSNYTIDFPYHTEFVSPPRIVTAGKDSFFVAVVQTSERTVDKTTKRELSRWNEVRLVVQRMDSSHNPEDLFLYRVQNWSKEVGNKDVFLDFIPVNEEKILVVYAKDLASYEFVTDKGIVPPKNVKKGAFMFDVKYKTPLKHFPDFLSCSSSLRGLQISSQFTYIMDSDLQVFKYSTNSFHRQITSCSFASGTVRPALDGRYLIGISGDRRTIVVVRTSDDKPLGSMYVHGRATCLEMAEDDRTVVVGCEDGRIMIMSLILEFADPLREYIEKLPSRVDDEFEENLILTDVRRLSMSTPDQHRLSARLREKARDEERRPPSYTTLQRAVTISRQNNRYRNTPSCAQQ
ncbi:NWD2-like protein [Mya arenaria]|uniref:NWD2-like protein n=1 Tax=Mya arenaria TaxID=6604 RepID=A0ABY7E6V1_MYAAR|nr:NACHT and WD repeat domain-containing protein 2-like [Mya arenaria]WAR02876.1 NWD2-like protein [Mya arenaria]